MLTSPHRHEWTDTSLGVHVASLRDHRRWVFSVALATRMQRGVAGIPGTLHGQVPSIGRHREQPPQSAQRSTDRGRLSDSAAGLFRRALPDCTSPLKLIRAGHKGRGAHRGGRRCLPTHARDGVRDRGAADLHRRGGAGVVPTAPSPSSGRGPCAAEPRLRRLVYRVPVDGPQRRPVRLGCVDGRACRSCAGRPRWGPAVALGNR